MRTLSKEVIIKRGQRMSSTFIVPFQSSFICFDSVCGWLCDSLPLSEVQCTGSSLGRAEDCGWKEPRTGRLEISPTGGTLVTHLASLTLGPSLRMVTMDAGPTTWKGPTADAWWGGPGDSQRPQGRSSRQPVQLGPLISQLCNRVLGNICSWSFKNQFWALAAHLHFPFSLQTCPVVSLYVLTHRTHSQKDTPALCMDVFLSPQRAYYFRDVLLGAGAPAALSALCIY